MAEGLVGCAGQPLVGVEGAKGLPPELSNCTVEEYLVVLDNAAFGAASEVTPKFPSQADPAAHWVAAQGAGVICLSRQRVLIAINRVDFIQ